MRASAPAIGQKASATRTFGSADVERYARLTGDVAAAPETVPGPLIGGMFSKLLGTDLPGRGTNWMKQRLTFLAPAPLAEPLTATVEVVRIRPEKDLVNLRTTCVTRDGTLVCEGEALVMAREMAWSERSAQ